MNVLIVGGTGTLGRQIVKKVIENGHSVRCLVRDRVRAQFLEEWGAVLYKGDLNNLENLPDVLEGVDAIITTASAGAGLKGNTIYSVDDRGNQALIEGAKKAGIKLFIFTSILKCDEYPNVPLMGIKLDCEKQLKASGMNYVIFRPSAFLQGVISQYAIPILEQKTAWVLGEPSSVSYISTLDAARFYSMALTKPEVHNKTFALCGTELWTPDELIGLCDDLADWPRAPKVTRLPLGLLKFMRKAAKYFEWTRYSADFFEFSEVIASGESFGVDMKPTCDAFGVGVGELSTMEQFLGEYYTKMKRKLKEMNYKPPKVRSPF